MNALVQKARLVNNFLTIELLLYIKPGLVILSQLTGGVFLVVICCVFIGKLVQHLDTEQAGSIVYLDPADIVTSGSVCGIGTDGTVCQGIWKSKPALRVAIKRYHKPYEHHEIAMLHALRDTPNVIQLYGVLASVSTTGSSRLGLVLEWMDSGTLEAFRTRLHSNPRETLSLSASQKEIIRNIFWQLLTALCGLKYHRIIHGDLKLDNILLNRFGILKLADFRLATQFIYEYDYVFPEYSLCYGPL